MYVFWWQIHFIQLKFGNRHKKLKKWFFDNLIIEIYFVYTISNIKNGINAAGTMYDDYKYESLKADRHKLSLYIIHIVYVYERTNLHFDGNPQLQWRGYDPKNNRQNCIVS